MQAEYIGINPFCLENWDEASSGEYNPQCCRFPKSCSADMYNTDLRDNFERQKVTKIKIKNPFWKFKDFEYKAVLFGWIENNFVLELYFKSIEDAWKFVDTKI